MYGFHYFPIVVDVLMILGGALMSCFFLWLKKQEWLPGNAMRNQTAGENILYDVKNLLSQLYRRMIGLGIFVGLLGLINLLSDCLKGPGIIKTITCCFLFIAFIVYGILEGRTFQKIRHTFQRQDTN
ncbi:MAG: hypothetical protein NC419_01705 [Muribaculaceae bacterium]|nr:hypothetical protein [Muribaculaceae bacterium]